MIALLQISSKMRERKDFENRPVFDKVIVDYGGLLFWPTL